MSHFRSAALAIALGVMTASSAQAVTFMIDFDSPSKVDIFGEETGTFDHTAFGFSASLTRNDVIEGIMTRVRDHFLGYVDWSVDVFSPLAPGFELDIDFEVGLISDFPTGGLDFAYIGVGPHAIPDPGLFGSACLGCVRDASGTPFPFGHFGTQPVGSIYTDAISSASGFASDDDGLFNLIAGTTSHEIAHTLSLIHTGAKSDNPGESLWGVMGSGATAMPTGERVLEREFTYANFGQLIDAVGVRPVSTAAVPLPATLPLLLGGLALVAALRRRRAAV